MSPSIAISLFMCMCTFIIVRSQVTEEPVCTYTFQAVGRALQHCADARLEGSIELLQHQVTAHVEETASLKQQLTNHVTQVTSLQSQVESLVLQNQQLIELLHTRQRETPEQGPAVSSGSQPSSVYVRWGRTVCPGNATLVYKGSAGGSHYSIAGGMTDYLCLPDRPQWNRYVNGFQGASSLLYGAEYQNTIEGKYTDNAFFHLNNNGGRSVHDHNVPCAVCQVTGRGSVMTFPAHTQCPRGWSLEYQGYLMAEREHTAHVSNKNAVCMDESPEVIPGGHADQNGALFQMVEAKCGSLPCPHYVDGREITCAVCTS